MAIGDKNIIPYFCDMGKTLHWGKTGMTFGRVLDSSSRAGPDKKTVEMKCSNFLANSISRESPVLPIKARVLFASFGIKVFS